MYRQGHGDCFLLAFPREGGGAPYYVLIDCGYKPGSQQFLDHGKSIGDVVDHLHASCGGRLDLVVLTHEHQDHLNGIWKSAAPYFEPFEVEQAWMAWTEDATNALANELRKRHKDQLVGLLAARRRLALAIGEDEPAVARVDALLDLELGGTGENVDVDAMLAAAQNPERSVNKQGMKLIKEKAAANKGTRFLSPGGAPLRLDGTDGIRAFILGPPEDADLISDEDPRGRESFPSAPGFSFAGSFRTPDDEPSSPFRRQFAVPLASAFERKEGFFAQHYGDGPERPRDADHDAKEVPEDAQWRRIDDEWLYSAETLALKLNMGINNTSLVIAFELPRSKKVLLFAADAQRGNWRSWKDVTFTDGAATVTAKDLLGRTVLYKVGHHRSHTATLAGTAGDDYPNLSWMGRGPAASEFTAMITAVNQWAVTKNRPPWVHPLPSIKAALVDKAHGRVFQTDENAPARPAGVSDGEWQKFTDNAVLDPLYFDWKVLDD
jgi:hypothetical protein